jgi:FkbM family methyltransferase
MAKMVGPTGRVGAFEPLRVIYQQLCGNVFINDLRNVFCFNLALGNKNEMIQMEYVDVDRQQGVNIGATKVGNGGDMVEMLKLDNVITSGVSFIKMDVPRM